MRPLSLVPDSDTFDGLLLVVERSLGVGLCGVGADEIFAANEMARSAKANAQETAA